MKITLYILFIINVLAMLSAYFLVKDEKQSQIIIGLSVMFFAFIMMPLFLFFRYKNKKRSDYTLANTKEKNNDNY